MEYTTEQVNQYMQTKKLAWSPKSISSESSRLHKCIKIWNSLNNKTAEEFYNVVRATHNPYTVKTMLIRFGQFIEVTTGTSNNPIKNFVRLNARIFRNVYEVETLKHTYETALNQIEKLTDERIKQIALLMLRTGMRVHEALGYDGGGKVIGKGAKIRTVYSTTKGALGISYNELYVALKGVGLKPHTLRKLTATKLVEAGLKEADLMAIMGWSSMQTASIYVQPKREDELRQTLQKVLV